MYRFGPVDSSKILVWGGCLFSERVLLTRVVLGEGRGGINTSSLGDGGLRFWEEGRWVCCEVTLICSDARRASFYFLYFVWLRLSRIEVVSFFFSTGWVVGSGVALFGKRVMLFFFFFVRIVNGALWGWGPRWVLLLVKKWRS